MLNYEFLSNETERRISIDGGQRSQYAFSDAEVIRRDMSKDKASIIRPPFIRDIDKIMHCPYYNRYADKTQVFSFYRNDDITRRGLHVQLVSRIARTIGRVLGLNLDLIEAIALGHDIGHTPFGHAGERVLDRLYCDHTGRHFSHNIHSVRVLDVIYPYNISLQTLCGIAAHDGEMEMCEYHPAELTDFKEFDAKIQLCYDDKTNVKRLVPSTLEGCVMRISDIIAYLGKDRQDAERAHIVSNRKFDRGAIGAYNAEIINNLIVNIVEHSYQKPYIKLDEEHFSALAKAKSDNYELIYRNEQVSTMFESTVAPMMGEVYERLLDDLKSGNESSPIFSHHIEYVNSAHYKRAVAYESTEPNQIVVDYIASMTDDYFIDLYAYLFPNSERRIEYVGYFD